MEMEKEKLVTHTLCLKKGVEEEQHDPVTHTTTGLDTRQETTDAGYIEPDRSPE